MSARSVFQHVSGVIGVLSNILLIVLIIRKSPKTLGSYKILMIYISIFEILYSILDSLIVPKMFSHGSGALIILSTHEAWLPSYLLLYANVLYCTFFGTSMAVFSVHFIYRYLAVSGSTLIKQHNKKLIIFLLLFPIIFGILWYILSFFTLGPFEEADLFIRKYYDQNIQLSDIYYVGYYYYPEDSQGRISVNWKGIVGSGIQSFFINVSFGLILYFGVKCHRITKSLSKNSSSSHVALQNQLFYALVFQTVIPVFLMHIPSTIGISICFLNMSKGFLGEILSCTISLYPVFDPLPNFFIIKSYRMAIINSIRKFYNFICCRKQPQIIQVQSRFKMSNVSKL